MDAKKEKNLFTAINPKKALYPVVIGLCVVLYLFYKDFNQEVFSGMRFTWWSAFWLFMAILCMFGRDIGYMIRIRILSDNKLTWMQSFRIIMLWEFTSAVTPSAVGGTSIAILYVHKEGIGLGKSSAMVLLTSFLDEIYFILMFPILVALVGVDTLFDATSSSSVATKGLAIFALVGYGLKFTYVIILSYGLFINPRGIKWLLLKIFKLRPLKRWHESANSVGSDLVLSSQEFKKKGFKFWGQSFAATFISWSSRYLVANALILAFFAVSDHFILFARQLVMWIIMLITPTPGGSGFAEYIFTDYCSDLISVPIEHQIGAALMIAFLWRAVTYYPYLFIGAIILPKWIKRNFSGAKGASRTSK